MFTIILYTMETVVYILAVCDIALVIYFFYDFIAHQKSLPNKSYRHHLIM